VPAAIDDIDGALREVTFVNDAGDFAWFAARGLVPAFDVRVVHVAPAGGNAGLTADILHIMLNGGAAAGRGAV